MYEEWLNGPFIPRGYDIHKQVAHKETDVPIVSYCGAAGMTSVIRPLQGSNIDPLLATILPTDTLAQSEM